MPSLIGIVPVTLVGPTGVKVNTCALLDNGSTRSFIDENLAEILSLSGKPMTYAVTTLTASLLPCKGREVDVQV